MALGSSILFCLYACLKAMGIKSRNTLMSTVHVDDIVALLQRHPVGALPSGGIVRVDGAGIVGHVGDIGGEGITIKG